MQLICLTNAYGMIHTRKRKWFTNAGSDLCETFEDSQARATKLFYNCQPEWIFIITNA